MEQQLNVYGEPLEFCSTNPMTGFFRDGKCKTCQEDQGIHTVCVVMTEDFLDYCKEVGNDLSTPNPLIGFQGLEPGDKWCLCAGRWIEALRAGRAPKVDLHATHEETLAMVTLETLEAYALKKSSP